MTLFQAYLMVVALGGAMFVLITLKHTLKTPYLASEDEETEWAEIERQLIEMGVLTEDGDIIED